jgi:hypothetical protein
VLEIPSFTHLNGQVGGSIIYPLKWLDGSFIGRYKRNSFGLELDLRSVEPVRHP